MFRLFYFIPICVLFLMFRTLMIFMGLFLIPPMAILRQYKKSTSNLDGREILVFKHKFMYPWSNDEDGIVAGEEFVNMPQWFRIIYWSAVRNPANNLRFIPIISCKIDPDRINFILGTRLDINGKEQVSTNLKDYDSDELRFTSLIWQGIYSNFRIQFKMRGKIWRFWLGWKIYAHDINGISPADYRYNGAGFATQFKRIYSR